MGNKTTLIARNGGKVDTNNLTNIGAVIGSESEKGRLKVSANKVVVEDKNQYENIGGGVNFGTDVPNISVKHDKVDKEQINRATAINTDISLRGKEVNAEDLGFNTDKSKAQEKTKDEEKHLDTELHTDLIGEDKRNEIKNAFKKLGSLKEILEQKKFKELMEGILVDKFKDEHQKEFNLIKDENLSLEDKQKLTQNLVERYLRENGYQGVIPELYITDEPNSFAVDGKNGETRKIFISLNDLKRGNSSALLYAHENAHLIQTDKDEEIAKYAETKIGENKNKFTENEKEEYISKLKETIKIDKTLEEQFEIARSIPESERENHSIEFFTSQGYAMGVRVSVTESSFQLIDNKRETVEMYEAISTSIGVGSPDAGASVGIGYYRVSTRDELAKLTKSFGISVEGFGIDILKEPYAKNKGILENLNAVKGIRIYIPKGIINVPLEGHYTGIEIGSPKNIRKHNELYKFYKNSMENGGEW